MDEQELKPPRGRRDASRRDPERGAPHHEPPPPGDPSHPRREPPPQRFPFVAMGMVIVMMALFLTSLIGLAALVALVLGLNR